MKSPCMSMQTVFMGMHMLLTCKPEMIRHILFERQKYVKMTKVSHDGDRLISQGVFSSEGEEWHRQRSSTSPLPSSFVLTCNWSFLVVLSPSFKYKKLKSLVPLFCETTAKLIGIQSPPPSSLYLTLVLIRSNWETRLCHREKVFRCPRLVDKVKILGCKTAKYKLTPSYVRTTLDAIGKAGFGYDFNAVDHGSASLVHTYAVIMTFRFRPIATNIPNLV